MKGLTIILGKMQPPSKEQLDEMQKMKGKEKPESEDKDEAVRRSKGSLSSNEEECEECGESPCECEDKPTMPTSVTGSH